jgi:hypothetical protein
MYLSPEECGERPDQVKMKLDSMQLQYYAPQGHFQGSLPASLRKERTVIATKSSPHHVKTTTLTVSDC